MSEENQILSYFKNFNSNSTVTPQESSLKTNQGNTKEVKLEQPISKKNISSGSINGSNGENISYGISSLKKNQNKPFSSDIEISEKLKLRGREFADLTEKAMANTRDAITLLKDYNNYDEEKGINPGPIKLAHPQSGEIVEETTDKLFGSFKVDDSFISNQVRYDKSGGLRTIGSNILDRLFTKASDSLSNAFEDTVNSILGNVAGVNITSSDYPFKGYNAMFGSLSFDPGSNSKYAIIISPPTNSDCAAGPIDISINNKQRITQDPHYISKAGTITGMFEDVITAFSGNYYPTCSPYLDIFASGWVPCTGFSLDYGRIASESLGISSEYQFEIPTTSIIAPTLTTEILDDNRQSVRRWLKDYMKFISPNPGFVRPYKTCCCMVTVLTYNKQWSRDPGDISDSILNLVSIGNSQNQNGNLLKYVFYAYPSTNISYQSSPTMNIDSVTIQWNIVGEKRDNTNVIGNLINKFI